MHRAVEPGGHVAPNTVDLCGGGEGGECVGLVVKVGDMALLALWVLVRVPAMRIVSLGGNIAMAP